MTDDAADRPSDFEWAGERGAKWAEHLPRMEAMLAPVDAPLTAALDLSKPVRIADIGCGGGATSRSLLAHAASGSQVVGFDISPDLIEQARSNSAQPALSFELADAATATPAEPFDRLTSRFGVMFFDSPGEAFANLSRWLVPGGQFAFAVWAAPADNPWMSSVRQIAATLAPLPAPDPEAPGPFRYEDAESFVRLLQDAGFKDVSVQGWQGKLAIGGGLAAEPAARFALTAFAVGDALVEAGDGLLEQAVALLAEHFAKHEQGGSVQMDAKVHLVSGKRG